MRRDRRPRSLVAFQRRADRIHQRGLRMIALCAWKKPPSALDERYRLRQRNRVKRRRR